MSVRLPTVGGGGPAAGEEPGVVRPAEARPDAPVPTIAIAAAVPTAPVLVLAERLVAAARARGVATSAVVASERDGEPTIRESGLPLDSVPGRLAAAGASPVRWARGAQPGLGAVLGTAFEGLPAGAWCIAVGNAVPARLRPRLTVLLTAGAARSAFSVSGRALLDRVDVELADPRAGFADGLATLL